MQLVIWLIDIVDERVDQFVGRAQREPLNEKLIDLILCNLEANISSELTCT